MQRDVGVVLCAAAISWLAGCASPGSFKTDDVPAALRTPADQRRVQQLHATGVQIYKCKPSKQDPTRLEWSLLAPDAVLVNHSGRKVAKHYAGPTWEALDGSRVTGEVAARADSPVSDSIPWLLLRAKTSSGQGIFGSVTFVQRLHTVGGNAPPSCSVSQADQQLRVAYSADYFFYAGAGS